MTKISIIIPIYNSEKYLRQCLTSVEMQTFKDFECLCIDDGSRDSSVSIVEEFMNRDSRFRLISQANQGASVARNTGLSQAKGQYIMFLDSDDWYEPNACEKAYEAITSENADVALFSGIWEYTNQSVINYALTEKREVLEEDACKNLRRKMFGLCGRELSEITKFDYLSLLYLKIYRKDIIQDNRLSIPDIRETGSFEDGLFNIYYFRYVKKAVYLGDALYHYRKDNDTSITTKYNSNLRMQWGRLFQMMFDIIQAEELDVSYKQALKNRISYSIVGIGSNCLNAPVSRREKRRQIKAYLKDENYRKAIGSFPRKEVPFIWKPLFLFAKWRWTMGVYSLLCSIKKIRKNKNN